MNTSTLKFPAGEYLDKVCHNTGGWWICKKFDIPVDAYYWSWIRS